MAVAFPTWISTTRSLARGQYQPLVTVLEAAERTLELRSIAIVIYRGYT